VRILNSVRESRFRTAKFPPISAQRGCALDAIALIRRLDPARARLAENAPGSSGCVFDAP
jgi:hypothetical protein